MMSGRVPQGQTHDVLRGLRPAMPRPALTEQLRAAAGAIIGLSICALSAGLAQDVVGGGWFLVAPLGATAVLVFAVPNSPLAQPWSAVAGNIVSALAAVAIIRVADGPVAAAVAVGAAILLMLLLRALHPPGGAVALLTVLDAEAVREIGFQFALAPVGATTALLVGAAILFNRWTGRVYPFRQPKDAAPSGRDLRLGLTTRELQDLLERFNQSTNLGVADLGRLLAAAESEAVHHRFEGTLCADVMTADLITVEPRTPLDEVARLFRRHTIKSIPVVDGAGRLLGIILQSDLLGPLIEAATRDGMRLTRPGEFPRRSLKAADVMQQGFRCVPDDMPVGALLNSLATQAVQVVPVTRRGRLVGVLTRSDILALLLRGAGERQAA